ncbi:MAG: hypothetical protein A2657_00065 [Candidatus Yanofskybacteria bacterium RIFCSPHIGHO2_01_FULL_44_110b]|uniref:Conjugal transfer protein TrbC n=2 Tax=Candidatus Yanofskyibacteriota TaxID=1752733 RepID=A0A0G1P1W1_9BACT|nr:MAG: hypothetical protein UW14_C0016G0004 [Candidatus Yanofskybacteria bacterium GW2011_GWA2_44_10]KKT90364.1 MAG: hypothetical protein UW90_C0002G0013 [Candidatus Yanofskybacteria bacterium GW2011_GWB1_45_11]OGN03269.1 MAG: hypothetical protein A2657_00065 [Candidatus Yanofskybacteria bacterium RIFCSPHIGHO2_01_FULL_44_110b]
MKLMKMAYGAGIAASLILPIIAMAALPNPTPAVSGTGFTLSEVEGLIRQIAQFLIVVSVIIAVVVIIYGGIRWMLAKGDPKEAKSIVWNGIVGAAIVLAVGVILQTIAGLVTRNFFR